MAEILPSTEPITLATELRKSLSPSATLRVHEPLSRRTTLRVGGPADIYVEPSSEVDLQDVLRFSHSYDLPWMVLGRGSNLLVKDGGVRGIVISLTQPFFSKIEIITGHIHCGAGARMRQVAFDARNASISGLEFLEGIPGSIGGGLRMNAGAMGSALFEHVETLKYLTPEGDIIEAGASDIPVEYRNCPLLKTNIALSVVLAGQPAERSLIEARMNECSQKRWSSQPAAPSAGCIFKNSVTIPAGRLVQELGLKGTRIGGAMISEVHGNFIVNDANGRAADVLALIALVKQKALEARGIELHTEVQIVGED